MHDVDDPLAAAFRELAETVHARGRLPGLAAARATARTRRARRAALTAAAAAVLLGSAGIVGLTGADPAEPVAGPGAARVLADLNPVSLLRDATVEIPPFDLPGCPSGRLPFQSGFSRELMMDVPAIGDIDHDGINDEIVPVTCLPRVAGGAGGQYEVGGQVLAFSGTDGRLLGRLRALTQAEGLYEARVDEDGVVSLDMFSMGVTGGPTATWREHYRWTGSRFGQPDREEIAADQGMNLVASADPGTLTLADGGPAVRLQVTIRNVGSALSQPIEVALGSVAPLVVEPDGWPNPLGRRSLDGYGSCTCSWRLLVEAPAPDEAVTLTFRLRLPAGRPLTALSQLSVGVSGHVNARALGEAWQPEPANVLLGPA